MATAELEQDMEAAILEGRRKQKIERRVHDIFVENDRRRIDRRAVDRRSPGVERRMSGRRDSDPNVDEMVERLRQQQHNRQSFRKFEFDLVHSFFFFPSFFFSFFIYFRD